MEKKMLRIYLTVNKNGFIGMHLEEPTRIESEGRWISKQPYVNSVLYKDMCEVVKKAKMTWESPCEYFEINYQQVK